MIYLFLSLGLFLFVLAFHFLRIVAVAIQIMATARKALVAVRSGDLSDDEKEAASRHAAAKLFAGFFSIFLRGAATLLISVAPAFLGIAIGLFTTGEAAMAASNGYFLGGSVLLVLPLMIIFR